MKAVLFDLWDTLVSFQKDALDESKDIYNHIVNKDKITYEEFYLHSKDFFDFYCKNSTFEVKGVNFWNYILASKGLILDGNQDEILNDIFFSYKVKEVKGALDFLNYLESRNIDKGVLSNSTHSSECISKYLHDTYPYISFKAVLASCTYGVKKPSPLYFELGVKKMGYKNEEIIFIGDNYIDDVKGSYNSNLHPIYLNYKNNKPDIDPSIPFIEVKSYQDLINLIEEKKLLD